MRERNENRDEMMKRLGKAVWGLPRRTDLQLSHCIDVYNYGVEEITRKFGGSHEETTIVVPF